MGVDAPDPAKAAAWASYATDLGRLACGGGVGGVWVLLVLVPSVMDCVLRFRRGLRERVCNLTDGGRGGGVAGIWP